MKLITRIYFAMIRTRGLDLATHFINERPLGAILGDVTGKEVQYIGKGQYRYVKPGLIDRYISRRATRGMA